MVVVCALLSAPAGLKNKWLVVLEGFPWMLEPIEVDGGTGGIELSWLGLRIERTLLSVGPGLLSNSTDSFHQSRRTVSCTMKRVHHGEPISSVSDRGLDHERRLCSSFPLSSCPLTAWTFHHPDIDGFYSCIRVAFHVVHPSFIRRGSL